MIDIPYLIAFDLGTRTGAVSFDDAGTVIGAKIIEAGPAGDGWDGISPDRVRTWHSTTMAHLSGTLPSFVAYEEVRHMKGRGAVWIHGATALLHLACGRLNIPAFGMNVSAVKKFATGKGNALKPQMLAQVPGRARGILWDATEQITTPGRDLPYTERMREQRMEDLVDAYWVGRYALDHGTILR
jgi:hypothetical protein